MFSPITNGSPHAKAFLLLFVSSFMVANVCGFSTRCTFTIPSVTNNKRWRLEYTFLSAKERDFEEAAFQPLNGSGSGSSSGSHSEAANDEDIDCTPRKFYKSSKIGNGASISKESGGIQNNKNSRGNSNAQTIKSLFRMMRPGNFPGVVLFHLVGIHRTLSLLYQQNDNLQGHTMSIFIQTILQPSILATLFALLLIVSTSMIVNDYYDALSGVDYLKFIKLRRSPYQRQKDNVNDNTPSISTKRPDPVFDPSSKPLASGQISLSVVKQSLNVLYAILLLTTVIINNLPTRIFCLVGSMLTFYYTKHLKPKLWFKNVACALLMSLSPLASGVATVYHPSVTKLFVKNNGILDVWRALGPLFASLFCGFMSRELIMDMTDHSTDKDAGIETVPVKYGKQVTSKIILFFSISAGSFIAISPSREVCTLCNLSALRRLSFALIGSFWLIIRAIQIVNSEGRDDELLNKAIEEAKLNALFFLASYI